MLRCLKFQIVGWSSDPDGHILGQISHRHTSPKTPRPEPNHQEHQQRYNRKGIKGKIQAKHKQEKQTNEIQNHSALFLRLCFIALVLVVSLYFLAQHHYHLEIFQYIRCFSWRLRRRISLVSLQRTERNTIQCWRHRNGRTLSGSKVTGRSNCKVAISVFESYSSWNLFWWVGCTKRISLLYLSKNLLLH